MRDVHCPREDAVRTHVATLCPASQAAPSLARARWLRALAASARSTGYSAVTPPTRRAIYRGPLPNYKAPTTQSPRMLFAASECGTIGTEPSMLFAARNDMKPIIASRPFFSSASCLRLSDSADIAPDKFAQS